jgi:peptidoglycan hydrolase-like protein with peptidoglycan-binding domain
MPFSSPRLNGDPALLKAGENQPALRSGAIGKAVRILQQALIDLGFAMPRSTTKGTPDGIFGPETEATIKAFQRDNAVSVDGVAGRDTLARLDQILTAIEESKQIKDRADAVAPFPLGTWFIT